MADISTIRLPDDSVYNIKDAEARTLLGGHSVGTDVPSDAVFTDTTYENKAAAENGTAVSLVTTGQKATWNAKANSNTTYTFSGGTNKFTVTPSGGTSQDVTITPSITNNVTGSGTSGYIAKFNGTNTLTNGPQIGTGTTTFLRNDGTWTSNISAGGYVSTNGKASVWDSSAGGIMSASGVLSLRADSSSTTPGIYVTAYGSTTTTYDAGFYYNATNDRWQSNKQIYAPSFASSGNIATSVSDTSSLGVSVQNSNGKVGIYASTNRGLYDYTRSAWIIYYHTGNQRNEISGTTYCSGSLTTASSIMVGSSTKDTSTAVHAISSGRDIDLLSQTSGAAGVYDSTNSKWVAYTLMDGTRGPLASTTENGFMSTADKTKLDGLSAPSGMAADGAAPSVSSGTSYTNLLTTGVTLTANHKYMCTYSVQWTSNANGRRSVQATIGGSTAGVISQSTCAPANGAATIHGATFWIQPSTSARTLNFQGYQNSGSALTATVRYQLIDFGT